MSSGGAWEERDGALRRHVRVRRLLGGVRVHDAGRAARRVKRDHHPDWSNSWNKVDIALSTHSAGSTVTDADRDLAAAIDELLG